MDEREHEQQTGIPTWADMTVSDVDAVAQFFTDVLGWQVDAGNDEFGGYRMAMRDGMAVCGLMADRGDGAGDGTSGDDGEPRPAGDRLNLYLATDDIDATLARVTELGGSIEHPAAEVGELGSMAFCRDPQGIRFGLWQAGSLGGFSAVDGEGLPTWFELRTPEPQAAAEFYGALTGVEFASQEVAGEPYLLCEHYGILPGEQGHWMLYLQVGAVAAATEEARSRGAEVVLAPQEFEYGTFADLRAPGGAPFGLLQPLEG